MPHLKCSGSKAITQEISNLLQMFFTLPLRSCYRSTKNCPEQIVMLAHKCPSRLPSRPCGNAQWPPLSAEPTNHSSLLSGVSWELQIELHLHKEQRNLHVVLAHRASCAKQYKIKLFFLGEANTSTGLIMPGFGSRNIQVLLQTPVQDRWGLNATGDDCASGGDWHCLQVGRAWWYKHCR